MAGYGTNEPCQHSHSDPVKEGFAASFNRPGGNATGLTPLTNQLEAKRLGLLRELMPSVTTIGFSDARAEGLLTLEEH
jgi:ABC-type uncharacterized transport system substrate-binding protein